MPTYEPPPARGPAPASMAPCTTTLLGRAALDLASLRW